MFSNFTRCILTCYKSTPCYTGPILAAPYQRAAYSIIEAGLVYCTLTGLWRGDGQRGHSFSGWWRRRQQEEMTSPRPSSQWTDWPRRVLMSEIEPIDRSILASNCRLTNVATDPPTELNWESLANERQSCRASQCTPQLLYPDTHHSVDGRPRGRPSTWSDSQRRILNEICS